MTPPTHRTRVGNSGNGFAYEEPLVFEKSRPGRDGYSLPELDVPAADPARTLPRGHVRDELPDLPELSAASQINSSARIAVPRRLLRLTTCSPSILPTRMLIGS